MRIAEELIKETVEEINRDYESYAKSGIKSLIIELIRQQDIIRVAQTRIKEIQIGLKEIEVKQVPSNFLI